MQEIKIRSGSSGHEMETGSLIKHFDRPRDSMSFLLVDHMRCQGTCVPYGERFQDCSPGGLSRKTAGSRQKEEGFDLH